MADQGQRPPTPQEQAAMRQQLIEQIGQLHVSDIVAETALTLTSIASARLGGTPETLPVRDLGEARAAIDALGALLPVLEELLGAPMVAELRQALAGLQMGYVQIAQESGAPPPSTPGQAPPPPPEPPPAERPKIWTPRGTV
jgi:hypothetical protein